MPNRGTPYVVATDGGTFEVNPNDFGSQSTKGGVNKWERGVPGNFLVTVNSPVNVWKTDLDADLTSGDYISVLQTPSYTPYVLGKCVHLAVQKKYGDRFLQRPVRRPAAHRPTKAKPGRGSESRRSGGDELV
ncbi:MAG: hypothetical protein IPJ30_25580 [Acidobacteria bacterium]|nr:hypothetical protein [Acidobacteriota bacterium]